MGRPLTLHERLIRKSLGASRTFWGEPQGSWQGGGYECESIPLTEEEHAEVERIEALVLCYTCHEVIEEGDVMLTWEHATYCEPHGHEALEVDP